MDVLIEDTTDSSLMELLYADDLVLCGESLNQAMDKFGRWKNAVKGKGLRVNVDKKKVCSYYLGRKVVFRNWILLVSVMSVVGCNFFQRTKCQMWVHRLCSNVPRQASLLSCRNVFV